MPWSSRRIVGPVPPVVVRVVWLASCVPERLAPGLECCRSVGRTKTSTLPKHVATRQGRHKEAGKGTYTSCSEGGGLSRGGLPTPLSGGVRSEE
eukprot:scaffold9333_cov119-Isochrysis_galbana.AAC.1